MTLCYCNYQADNLKNHCHNFTCQTQQTCFIALGYQYIYSDKYKNCQTPDENDVIYGCSNSTLRHKSEQYCEDQNFCNREFNISEIYYHKNGRNLECGEFRNGSWTGVAESGVSGWYWLCLILRTPPLEGV